MENRRKVILKRINDNLSNGVDLSTGSSVRRKTITPYIIPFNDKSSTLYSAMHNPP